MSMGRNELAHYIEEDAGLSRAKAREVLDSILNSMVSAFEEGRTITIQGFGSWTVEYRAPRNGTNPKSGTKIYIEGYHFVKFRPSKRLNSLVATVEMVGTDKD